MPITIDCAASLEYRKRLKDYFSANVLTPDLKFICKHEAQCRPSAEGDCNSFAAGQLSYVGDGYAAEENGVPMRILIAPIQAGPVERISMERRHEQIRCRIKGKRNSHMRGVTRILQVLWGLPPDKGSEYIDGDLHVLDAFAMANSTLCSKTDGESRQGEPTDCMRGNCSTHLRRTIELLEPTIIVTQGKSPEKAIKIKNVTDKRTSLADFIDCVSVGRVKAIWCRSNHPSYWRFEKNYFPGVVKPALQEVRELALSGGCG